MTFVVLHYIMTKGWVEETHCLHKLESRFLHLASKREIWGGEIWALK